MAQQSDLKRYRPNSFWRDPVAVGKAAQGELIHRVLQGYVKPAGTPLDDMAEPAEFVTACGLTMNGQAVHGIMNTVDCADCWEVPLMSFDRDQIEERIIGRRRM